MEEEKKVPQFMMVYRCKKCGQESGMTEIKEPACYYCDDANSPEDLELISQKLLTPEVMTERLKAVTDNMMKHLRMAYDDIPEDDQNADAEVDTELELLKIMAMAKDLSDKVQNLDLTIRNQEGADDEVNDKN